MRIYALSIFFLFSSLCCFSQAPKFDIKFSEPLAIFSYVDQLSSKHPDNVFKKQFSTSIYNREKYKTLLAQFDTLRINYSYHFEGFPYGSKNPGMTEALIKKNLISSANLKDFKKRAIGILPNSTLLQLSAILYEFQIVYRELVYQPNKTKFEKQLTEITELIKTKNLSTYFDKGLTFYKSNWDESFAFEIAFYPFPDEVGFSAEAFCNNAICAITPDTKDYKILLGVVMHEIYHILYNEQSVWVKNNIAKWFAANSSKCSVYGYHLLNEVLATALGNGYVYESLSGKKDEGDWYNRKYVDLMAKKIYPMVVDYITQKKPIDEGFVNIYLKFYDENYSDWLNEMSNIMCYRYIITDSATDFSVFSKQFPYASLSQYEDQVTELSIQKLKATPVTKIIIVSKDNETKLAMIKKEFTELKEWKYKAKTDFIYTTFLEDKTQFLLINTVKNTTEQMINGRILLPK
ncbi:hypothetical protein CNR22_09165 [Sphingobacteriaceae bacterium]|nr:hypothetical protein CNR22_09165 [Sphingobacteriaceae bacterium]